MSKSPHKVLIVEDIHIATPAADRRRIKAQMLAMLEMIENGAPVIWLGDFAFKHKD